MKKVFTLILSLILLVSICSCSKVQEVNDSGKTDDLSTKMTVSPEETKPIEQNKDNNAETGSDNKDINTSSEKEDIPDVNDNTTVTETNSKSDVQVNNSVQSQNKNFKDIHPEALTDGEIYFPSKKTAIISIEADMKVPESVSELYSNSKNIVVCDITEDTKSINYRNIVNMEISSAKIVKVIKGDLKENETINIHETGTRKEDGDISIGGTPLLRKNMRVLLFLLEPTDTIMDGETSYGIAGCYYGKFFYDNGGTLYSAADYADDGSSKLSDFSAPMKEDRVLSKINEIELASKATDK